MESHSFSSFYSFSVLWRIFFLSIVRLRHRLISRFKICIQHCSLHSVINYAPTSPVSRMYTPFPLLSLGIFSTFLPFSLRLLGLDQFTKENGGKETCFFGIIISFIWVGALVKCNLFYISANVSFHFTCFFRRFSHIIAFFFLSIYVDKNCFFNLPFE